MNLKSYRFTNPGGREHNEDAVGFKSVQDGELFVVADGLGGHQCGEVASKLVVNTLLGVAEPSATENGTAWLKGCVKLANEALLRDQIGQRRSMKSTVVALLVKGRQACWAHVGDSRLYYFHRGALAAVTGDHSVAFRKYLSGEITKAQIGQDIDQSSLLRALGNRERSEPDLGSCAEPLESGDAFLLCTDGVWEYLLDEEILIDLLKSESPSEWANLLLLREMDRIEPENDNLSLITVMVE